MAQAYAAFEIDPLDAESRRDAARGVAGVLKRIEALEAQARGARAMRDWRTDEEKAADEQGGQWLLLEAWVIALGLEAITIWGLASLM